MLMYHWYLSVCYWAPKDHWHTPCVHRPNLDFCSIASFIANTFQPAAIAIDSHDSIYTCIILGAYSFYYHSNHFVELFLNFLVACQFYSKVCLKICLGSNITWSICNYKNHLCYFEFDVHAQILWIWKVIIYRILSSFTKRHTSFFLYIFYILYSIVLKYKIIVSTGLLPFINYCLGNVDIC